MLTAIKMHVFLNNLKYLNSLNNQIIEKNHICQWHHQINEKPNFRADILIFSENCRDCTSNTLSDK